jgi:hypothetical protein
MTIAGGLSVSSVFYIQSASGQTAQVLNGPPATPKVIYLQTNANSRWHITSDGVAEGGGNSGSNFAIARYTDAGGIIDVPFYIQRSTGLVNIITNLQVNGAMTATSGTFTNVLVNPLNNQSGITLTRFTDTSPLGNFLFGQIAAGGTTLFAVDVNGQGYFKNAILYGGGLLSGSPVGYAGAPVVAVKPFANGGDTFYGQRFTDTAPAGYFLRLRNAANTADLFYVDLGGFLSTANGINAAGGINTSGWLSGSGNIQALPPSNGGLYVCWNRTNGAGESAIFNTYINTPAAQPSFNFFQMTSPTTTALIGSLAQAGATFASLTVGTGATLNTTVGSGAIAARQMVNGGDTIVCQRATDAASTGQFIRFIDAANLNTIFQVGMSGDTLSLGNIKGNTLQTSQFTVANLAGIPNVQTGHRAFVTDCNTAVFNAPVAAGGSNKVPVFYNGTGWMVG